MRVFPILLRTVLALASVGVLVGCGNETDMDPGARLLKLLGQAATARMAGGRGGAAAPEPTDLELREALEQGGKPIIGLHDDRTGGTAFLAPVAVNRGITTWSSNDRLTLSSRDGVLLATRGFGADLMAANVPSAAQISRGSGSYDRLHVYLDGADQTQKFSFTCTLASAGSATITVMGLSYATRHITETCTGPAGTEVNHYWFQGNKIRQSTQFLAPGAPGLTLQAIID